MNKKLYLITSFVIIGLLALPSIDLVVKAQGPIPPTSMPLTTPMDTVMLMTDEQFVYGLDLHDPLHSGFFYDVSDFTRRRAPAIHATQLQSTVGGFATADEVIDFHAHFYSVNPKLLLSLLEVTGNAWNNADKAQLPFGLNSVAGGNFYSQSDWLAHNLATYFYAYRQGYSVPIIVNDQGEVWLPANAASYAIARVVTQLTPISRWKSILATDGEFTGLYRRFFGPTPTQPPPRVSPQNQPGAYRL